MKIGVFGGFYVVFDFWCGNRFGVSEDGRE